MHSKWQIWDFFKNVNREFLNNFQGVLIINTFDPLCLKMVKDYLFGGLSDSVVLHKTAQEVSKNWIESEFQTLSLFPSQENIFIHHAHELNTEEVELLSDLNLNDRFLILSFENQGPLWKKIIQNKKNSIIEIEPPKFWEFNKVLDFLSFHFKLKLSFDLKNWILESFENSFSSFYQVCAVLRVNFSDQALTLEQAKLVLSPDKIDQFHLASLFARKKNAEFYAVINHLDQDFDKIRDLFRFLQSHVIKLLDTSFIKNKTRTTQYDRELLKTACFWSENELRIALNNFSSLEILAKKKDSKLWIELKSAQLNSELNL